MRYSIGNNIRYKQEFVIKPLVNESILESVGAAVVESLGFSLTNWAICGGAALTLLFGILHKQPTLTQDLDILLDKNSYNSFLEGIDTNKYQYSKEQDSISKHYGYASVPKLNFLHVTKFGTFNQLQIVNNNPAAKIVLKQLYNMQSFYPSPMSIFAIERIATYYKNKNIEELESCYSLGTDKPFLLDTIRYLASFDITLAQVALIFNGSTPICFVVASEAITSMAFNQLSLTKEQLDMYAFAKGPVVKKHLEIVTARIEKYKTRFNLEVTNEVEDAIRNHKEKLGPATDTGHTMSAMSSELPF